MSKHDFWNADWAKGQQDYWQNWSELQRRATGRKAPPKRPWEQAMDHWWEAVSPAVADPGQQFMQRMMEQGKQLFSIGETFSRNPQESDDEWQAAMERTFADLQSSFSGAGEGTADDALNHLLGLWQQPAERWAAMAPLLSQNPQQLLHTLQQPGSDLLQQVLSMPGLGFGREQQEQQQRLLQLGLAYQQSLQRYTAFFSDIGQRSVERMRQRVAGLAAEQQSLDSARQLYDSWVACCEAVYGEQVATSEYAQLHGQLVNSLMALKQQANRMVEASLGELNIPTMSELRTLQRRVQEGRREIKALRGELDALKAQVAAAAKPRPAVKRKVARKQRRVLKPESK